MSNLPKILKTKTPRMVTRRGSSEVDITQKFIPIILLIALLFPLFSKPIQAFSTETFRGGYHFNFESAVFKTEEMNLQSFVNETFKAVGASIWTSIMGCGSCSKAEREKYPGLIASIGQLTAGIYTSPPASGIEYFADIGGQLGIVTPAYAQERGIGFEIMKPLLPVWKAFRNLSYLFFVIILVGMGFAIMFRIKISPQAVISIQSALPRIVLALILITFSYAIVGFLLDFLVVLFLLITQLFGGILVNGILEAINLPGMERLKAALEALWGLILPNIPNNRELIMSVLGAIILYQFSSIVATFFIMISVGPISFLLAMILSIILFFITIKILWTLIRAYAMIVVNLIFAPFMILVGVLPGSGAIGNWFRSLLANIAVLPTILVMFYLSEYLLITGVLLFFKERMAPATVGFINVIMGEADLGEFLRLLLEFVEPISLMQTLNMMLLPIIGFAILMMAPKAADMIKAFFTGQPFAFGAAIGAPIGAAIQVVAAPVRYVTQPITAAAREAWGEEAGYKIPLIRDLLRTGAQRRARTGER